MLLGLLAVVLLLTRGADPEAPLVPPAPSSAGSVDNETAREAAVTDLLFDLTEALSSGTRKETVALAAPGNRQAARSLGFVHDNVRELDITDLSMRFVDENAGRPVGTERLGRDGFVADVQLTWRVDGFDQDVSRMEVSLSFVTVEDDAGFVSASGDYGNRAPLWLLDDLAVRQSADALVMAADPKKIGDFLDLAEQAVVDVHKVLPRWRGKLVVEVPQSREQLNQTLAAEENAYDAIAAITTTVDGSISAQSPTHITINPVVFGKLGDDGAQIVMSHEATHVATDAATSPMPLWLLEGFADYVALAHVNLPVSVTASQTLADVRRNGLPNQLPTGDDFNPASEGLGATYESAWLACRYLADEYGERQLLDFYRAVDDGASTDEAFDRVLNTTERQFIRGWQDYLKRLTT